MTAYLHLFSAIVLLLGSVFFFLSHVYPRAADWLMKNTGIEWLLDKLTGY